MRGVETTQRKYKVTGSMLAIAVVATLREKKLSGVGISYNIVGWVCQALCCHLTDLLACLSHNIRNKSYRYWR